MKTLLLLVALIVTTHMLGQNKKPEDFGYRFFEMVYKGDTVQMLVKSKKGEEEKPKPLLLFCQGSVPHPLIMWSDKGTYGVFPFNPDSLIDAFHIAIVSKPCIPVMGEEKKLGKEMAYIDSTGKTPTAYYARNYLDYYVNRNIAVIEFLQHKQFISKQQLVLAGHSEGSTIVAKLAYKCSRVTHLIYSGGNPLGRITSIVKQNRDQETDTDSTRYAERVFTEWKRIADDPMNTDASDGDPNKTTYSFSEPPYTWLSKLKIPVLVCYGTKDWTSPYCDYLRIEMMRQHKNNFTFKAYIGTEHNYFPVQANGSVNYNVFNWNKVADHWKQWLDTHLFPLH
jgi:pimeloyl-ACP methyl ester carboxylesterase